MQIIRQDKINDSELTIFANLKKDKLIISLKVGHKKFIKTCKTYKEASSIYNKNIESIVNSFVKVRITENIDEENNHIVIHNLNGHIFSTVWIIEDKYLDKEANVIKTQKGYKCKFDNNRKSYVTNLDTFNVFPYETIIFDGMVTETKIEKTCRYKKIDTAIKTHTRLLKIYSYLNYRKFR